MLQSERLRFRALRADDLLSLNEWRNDLDNKIMAQGYRLPVSVVQDENWIKSKMSNTQPNEVFFMLETIEETTPVGLIQLTNIDYFSGTGVWGFIIGNKSMRGKGFAKEALLHLFNYAFNILNLRKLNAYTVSYNEPLFKTLKKLGKVQQEGRLQKHYFANGEYHDVVITAVFREDYPNLYLKSE